jgi:putative Holliday junction resolvase
MPQTLSSILALDVGSARIGVALASSIVRIAVPFVTLDALTDVDQQLAQIINSEMVNTLVVGLPRGLDGQETEQTITVRDFAESLKHFGLPIHFQDEALTSRKAKDELESRGKPYVKADVDALAATYILEDYLGTSVQEVS